MLVDLFFSLLLGKDMNCTYFFKNDTFTDSNFVSNVQSSVTSLNCFCLVVLRLCSFLTVLYFLLSFDQDIPLK